MKIVVIAVGKMREPAVKDLVQNYSRRLPPGGKVKWVEVPAASARAEARSALAREAERIQKQIPERAHLVALSERGAEKDSMAFARWLSRLGDQGKDVCFVIGSASGLHPSLLQRADETLALSRLTFPHELTRAILAEQLYRAFTIIRNQPYHRKGV